MKQGAFFVSSLYRSTEHTEYTDPRNTLSTRKIVEDYVHDFDTQAKAGLKPNGFHSPGQRPEDIMQHTPTTSCKDKTKIRSIYNRNLDLTSQLKAQKQNRIGSCQCNKFVTFLTIRVRFSKTVILLSVTLYCKLWSRLNTPCQSGVVSECGYMFWRMRDSKALKKDHHYNKYSDGLYLNNCFYYRWSNGRSEMIRLIINNC